MRLFSFIDLPDVLTKIKGDTSCQQKYKRKTGGHYLNICPKVKLKQRHNEAVDIEPAEEQGFSYLQVQGTEFIQLEFEDEIGDDLIDKVARWSESRKGVEKISMSVSDPDVVQLKTPSFRRASAFVDYCSKSSNPLAEEVLWGIWEVFK